LTPSSDTRARRFTTNEKEVRIAIKKRSSMKTIKAIYDGKQVKLLEPVSLPPNTPLTIVVPKRLATKGKKKDPWDNLGDDAMDLEISDLAEQHDYYLYGVPKRRRKS
jgi:hypothetical protein